MEQTKRPRTALLDTIRGLTVINMVLYHAIWDLVYIFGVDWEWYHGNGAYVWQQCICCTFILLSGFCAGMSKKPFKRGIIVFGIGAVVTLVTAIFMPNEIVVFGVLTLIGSCMLLMIPLKPFLEKIPTILGGILSLVLFLFTRHVSWGYLGFLGHEMIQLPDWLYANYVTAYFGFDFPEFYSTDYFPLFPWLFLFLTGYFLFRLIGKYLPKVTWKGIAPLNFIGRHALEIYVVHQPIIYGICLVWNSLANR